MPTYRYTQVCVNGDELALVVPGAVTVGATAPFVAVDVTADSGSKNDLDAVMLLAGWTFDSTDPVTTPAQEFASSMTAAPVNVGTTNAPGTSSSLVRADHVHNLPFGPVQTALGAATGTVSINGQRITNVGAPVTGGDATNKTYVDAIAAGLKPKGNCRLLSDSNITLSGLQTIDSVMTVAADRIYVVGQTNPVENGIYLAAVGAWTRALDVAAGSEASGDFAFVTAGTVYADTGWICTTPPPADVVGTDPITFTKFSAFILSNTPPVNVTKSAAAVGTATKAARSDHKHDISTAAAVSVSNTNSEGSSVNLARADHGHDHGAQALGTGNQHAAVTALVNGFMAFGDKVKLDGVASGATATPLTASAPVDVTKSAAVVGVATDAARADHKHSIATAVPVSVDSANSEGVSASLARADHTHNLPFGPVQTALAAATGDISVNTHKITNLVDPVAPQDAATRAYVLANSGALTSSAPVDVTKSAAVVGIATTAARADHKHSIATAVPVSIDSANSEGASTSLARADHIHDHGAQPLGTGTGHAVATTLVAGFMSAADKVSLGAAVPGTRTVTAGAGMTGGGALSANITLNCVGNVDGSIVCNPDDLQVGTLANDEQHGVRGGGNQHALCTTLNAGFMSAADKTKLNGIPDGGGSVTPLAVIAATGNITTTSTTDVLATSMTSTPAAGTYLIYFTGSTWMVSADSTHSTFANLYAGGVKITGTEITMGDTIGFATPFTCVGVATVNGSQAIEGRWRISSGGCGPATMVNGRNLLLIKVG